MELFSNLPEPPGVVVYSYSDTGTSIISLEGMNKGEAEDYLKIIKSAGFTTNSYETEDDTGFYYGASLDDNIMINFSWFSDGTAVLSHFDTSEMDYTIE
ncbi:MAG: hypothetical protein GXY06_01870 [Clostridiaceae bacterium]|nr:hypothetical protein [Clostridiaceae bacterium]